MDSHTLDTSGFNDNPIAESGGVDFSRAERLERSGSTCDVYVARVQRRRVFVKRLKEEFRTSPRHRAAFDKEFDVGVKLSHPALPDYREFHGEYIVMDFIDGSTLADMIGRHDPWLAEPKNLKRMVGELIDVIDYLHQRDVVHCDIKPDNVMITHGARNLKLIDLDKAYADWLEDTSGSPAKYNLAKDAVGSPDMDFRGVALILDRLKEAGYGSVGSFARFSKLCRKPGVTADELCRALPRLGQRSRQLYLSLALVAACIVVAFVAGRIVLRQQPEQSEPPVSDVRPTDTVFVKPASPESANTFAPTQVSEEIINAELAEMLKPLAAKTKHAEALAADSTATADDVRQALIDLADAQADLTAEAYRHFKQRYPEAGETLIELTVANSRAYTAMSHRIASVSQKIADRIDRMNRESDAR